VTAQSVFRPYLGSYFFSLNLGAETDLGESPLSLSISTVLHATPPATRAVFCGLITIAMIVGVCATGRQETGQAFAQAGTGWANLLRAMALLKACMAVAASAAVVWRLGSPAGTGWLSAYVLAGGAMMAGPGLI